MKRGIDTAENKLKYMDLVEVELIAILFLSIPKIEFLLQLGSALN
jgi:hypothetical protein